MAEPTSPWKVFDHANPPDGVYWMVLEVPEYDCGVDDYGKTIGWPTGKTETIVRLAQVDVYDDGEVVLEAVCIGSFGDIPDEAVAKYYREVDAPVFSKGEI